MKLTTSQLFMAGFVFIGVTTAASDLLKYQNFVLQKMAGFSSSFSSANFSLWLLNYFPIAIVAFCFGYISRSMREVILVSLSGAISSHIYNHIAAILQYPGHLKSWASESATAFWSVGLVIQILVYLALIAAGFGFHAAKRRIQNAT